MSLHLRFWGTRGSIPSPGPATVRHGGNTSCLEVRGGDGRLAILDAGTGIRGLGDALLADAGRASLDGDVYLTHAHWDHIQGLPFFAPLYEARHRFRLWSSPALATRVERAVRAQMAPEVFPIPFEQVRAGITFGGVDDGSPPAAGALAVTAHPARHPGGALGYRVAARNAGGPALVYLPDNELDPDAAYEAPADWRARLVGFVRGAALLVHDAMYTTEEAATRRGWGHSTVDQAVQLALDAGVPRLALFHHHPERTDDELDALVAGCRRQVAALGGTLDVLAASEGLVLTL